MSKWVAVPNRSQTRFEVDVLPLAREVRYQKRRPANFGDDLVVDLVCVFLVKDEHRRKASSVYGRFDTLCTLVPFHR